MRAYFAITGTLFALLALWHAWRLIAEWDGFTSAFWVVAFTMLATSALSFWAWRLFADAPRYD